MSEESIFNSKNTLKNKNIYPSRIRNPYYIVTSRYVRTSAGIKVLHYLCHALNSLGERAYLIINPYHPPEYSIHPDLLTPLLTQKIVQSHFDRGLTPIMIYPETIPGNLYDAPFVVRYLLNYPGLLGGDKVFDSSEFCISYSKKLGESIPNNQIVLFIPVSDPTLFYPEFEKKRQGTCFYASKFIDYHNEKPSEITKNSFEITRDLPDSLGQDKIAELFRTSEFFYCYENSSLIIESVLCGCPVVMLPNKHLKEFLLSEEFGFDGIAWGTKSDEIERALDTVSKGREKYLKLFQIFEDNLLVFIEKTQKKIKNVPYDSPIKINDNFSISYFKSYYKIKVAKEMFKYTVIHSGLRYAIFRVLRRILKKGFTVDLDRTGV